MADVQLPRGVHRNKEAPTKQPFEGEKQETRNSPTTYKLMSYLEDPSKVAKHPLYYRTMEYPMVLAPMMKDENYQLNNTKIASQNFNQASSSQNEFYYKSSKTEEGSSKMDTPQTDNNPATIEIPAASDTPGTTDTPCTTDTAGTTDTQATTDTPTTTDTPRTMDHPDEDTASSIDTPAPMITQASKDNAATVNTPSTKNTSTTMGTPTLSLDNDRSVEKSTGKPSNTSESSGNFLDGDFPDIKPSKEFSEQQSFSVLLESPPNKKSLSTPSEKPHSRRTSTNSQDKAKPLINEFDEVIEDLSGVPCEENKNPEECQLRKNGKNARSSVEVFRQGYKAQHETEEQLPTLARYKKSVFNKKANYFITEE
ncbi:hypothetical protein HHI36_022165 [Cryptolaemus montrouzieri]|uniref:Uncharacterized protein n=1 Tax=Cryptolaemus montrouzieri TaxID=559131 RepID=A0ABD2MZV3_9CUCU